MRTADSVLKMRIQPTEGLNGELTVPGDKSISHRLAMLCSLARGTSTLQNYLMSDDCIRTLDAMKVMGAGWEVAEADNKLRIHGGGLTDTVRRGGVVDLGNSGTGMRLLTGLFAGCNAEVELQGDASLMSRPMRRIKDPLERMGAHIELKGREGLTGPVLIRPACLKGMEYKLPVASAQVKSAVLLAAMFADGETVIHEPVPCRNHTETVFQCLQLPLSVEGQILRYQPGGVPNIQSRDWVVPGDFSSAAFWIVAGLLPGSGGLLLKGSGLNPRRTGLLSVLRRMGADINISEQSTGWEGEPVGDIEVRPSSLKSTEIGGAEIPNVIDEIPVLCIAAAFAAGDTVISDAAELRVKESDRISVMCRNLEKAGIAVTEQPDGMIIHGGSYKPGAGLDIDSGGDHRIAMSFAVLAQQEKGDSVIRNTGCVETSYPLFWEHLTLLGGHYEPC